MTFKVQLQPSGHEFFVESNESVLEAGLRSGMNLRYNCSNGNCGECKARIVSGEVKAIRQFDHPISEADKLTGVTLLCSCSPTTNLVVEAFEARHPEDIPVQSIEARVSKLERLSDDVMSVQLRTPRSSTLKFLAGQHATIQIDGLEPRNKSIASCPCNGMQLDFHVHRADGDSFANFVHNDLRKSDVVSLRGPWGHMQLDEESGRPVLLVAFNTGFAPIKSLIEHAIALELEQPMHLFWIVSTPDGHYMKNYARSWVDALDDFQYSPVTLEEGGDVPLAEALFNATRTLLDDYSGLDKADVYLALPDVLHGPVCELLEGLGVPSGQIHMDKLERC